jgi:glycolate oxidase FAD binding subunit
MNDALAGSAAAALAPASAPAPADAALARLVEQVRAASVDGTALAIRGGGSKDFYGSAAQGGALSTQALRGITSYEPTELVITARAGTPLAEVEAALAEKNQCLAFEPPRFGAATTVGGMIAAGLSGPARASVGCVRDFVLGATILNGRGELLHFGGKVMKNVAGYDVARVFAGSMGVLGVICEVSIKVPPVSAARATLELACAQDEAIAQLHAWSAAAQPISASAWRDGLLRVRLSGAAAAVEAATSRLLRANAKVLEPPPADDFWKGLRDHTDPYFAGAGVHADAPTPAGADAAAPPARPEIPARSAKSAGSAPSMATVPAGSMVPPSPLWRLSIPSLHPPLELPGEVLVEWGGAQRWLRSEAAPETIRDAAARAGGHATLFRGNVPPDGHLAPVSPVIERIHRALKQSFDPAGIFNRGRLYPWL